MNNLALCRLGLLSVAFLMGPGAMAQNCFIVPPGPGLTPGAPVITVPPAIRKEGITEQVGDLLMNCPGFPGDNTQFNFQTNSNVAVFPGSNPLLMVNDPQPGKQILCQNLSGCPASVGANIYKGQVTSSTQVTWFGVPVLATSANTTLRITDVRVNAAQLGVPTSVAFVIDGQNAATFSPLTIPTAPQTVAFIQPGLVIGSTNTVLQQCNNLNVGGGGSGGNFFSGSGVGIATTNVNVREGFAQSFKRRDVAIWTGGLTVPLPQPQNIPGYAYNTESGFYDPTLFTAAPTTGLADFGTRIRITFNNIGAGVNLFVPVVVPLTGGIPPPPPSPVAPGINFGALVLINTDANGVSAPGFMPIAPTVTFSDQSKGFQAGAEIQVNNGTATAVYEVVNSDAGAIESANVPVGVAFVSNVAQNLPTPGQATVNVSFAPIQTTNNGNATTPRFTSPTSNPLPVFNITQCSTTPSFSMTNGASFTGGVAPDSIASGFGANLLVQSGNKAPLAATVATQVQLTDAKGATFNAELFLVTAGQINFVIPGAAALGSAAVKVVANGTTLAAGTVSISNVAPGMFANSGIAAAQILRVKAGGAQSYEPVIQLNAQGQLVPLPIDFGAPDDQLYFIGYGTGFRRSTSAVKLLLGQTNLPILYSGAQGGFDGLDQVDAGPIPRSFAGTGDQAITFSADGIMANSVKITFK